MKTTVPSRMVHVFSYKLCKIFKKTYLEKHLQTATSAPKPVKKKSSERVYPAKKFPTIASIVRM